MKRHTNFICPSVEKQAFIYCLLLGCKCNRNFTTQMFLQLLLGFDFTTTTGKWRESGLITCVCEQTSLQHKSQLKASKSHVGFENPNEPKIHEITIRLEFMTCWFHAYIMTVVGCLSSNQTSLMCITQILLLLFRVPWVFGEIRNITRKWSRKYIEASQVFLRNEYW